MENFETPGENIGGDVPELIANNIKIEKMIGRGGMGTVYRATHLSLDRTVAVKIINSEFATDSDVSQRFTREARLMAKLRHPKAAMIYDSGTLPDGRLFIVMEYVEGTSLADILEKEKRLPYRRAVEIAVSICDVLSEAHALGIVHRDLKPGNIMLNGRDVYVLDFGIAKMLKSDNAESLRLSMTGKGHIIGTPFYMSPEQCLGEAVDARSDLYSLGAVIYEMIAGRPPFDDEVLSAIIIKHAMVEAPPLEDFSADVPANLAAVVKQLLQKKPDDRPASAAATQVLLEASIANQTVQTANFAAQNRISQESVATQKMNAATMPEIARDSTEIPAPKRSNNLIFLGIGGVLLFLFASTAIGLIAYFSLISNENITANANANTYSANSYSNSYTTYPANSTDYGSDHSNHGKAMGEDFAANTTSANTNSQSAPILTTEQADEVLTFITNTTEHRADGVQIIKTPKDTALVCLHNVIEAGATHTFTVERPNLESQWQITARVSLDVPEFRSSTWKFEPEDVNGDGFEEVIFSATSTDKLARRVLIYEPRTRQSYWVLGKNLEAGDKAWIKYSANAETSKGEVFKKALEKTLKTN